METEAEVQEEDAPVCDCGAQGQMGLHCPYAEDVGSEIEICECCTKCAEQCADDI
jgi:hypothetical protein